MNNCGGRFMTGLLIFSKEGDTTMAKKIEEQEEQEEKIRKVYTFTLHLKDDDDLVQFLNKNKVTKNVKKGLRMIIEEEKKQNQLEDLDKNQLLSIISLLSKNSNLNLNNLNDFISSQDEQSASLNKEEEKEEKDKQEEQIDEETMAEYNKILQETGGSIGGLNIKIPGL